MSSDASPERSGSEEGETPAFRPALFYAWAFGIAWMAWAPLVLIKLELLRLPIPFGLVLFAGQTLGAFAPVLALFAMQRGAGQPGVAARVFRRLRLKGTPAVWLIAAATVPIGITMIIQWSGALISGEEVRILRPEPVQELGWALAAVIPFQFALGLIGSPLGEEPGWRGYVLEGFANRGRGLAGSAIVAPLWWVWHLPLFFVLGVEPSAGSLLAMAGHSLLIDSFYLAAGRNLLTSLLYHQGINTSFLFLMSSTERAGGGGALLAVALVVRMVAHRSGRAAGRAPTLPNE